MKKKKNPKKELEDTHVPILERGIEEREEKAVQPEDPDGDSDFELMMDCDESIVAPIDGVIIEGDEEQLRLLFFHYKTEAFSDEDEAKVCKCVTEFRVSLSTFTGIARIFNKRLRDLKTHQTKIYDYGHQEKLPMFA